MTVKREDVISMVRDAEARSAERIENAKKRAEEMRSAAVREAMAIRGEAEQRARDLHEKIIGEKRMEIEKKRKEVLARGEEEARGIRTHGTSNLPKVVDILLSKLESEE
jgi:vacuolar-type H+-ATPase subunit H